MLWTRDLEVSRRFVVAGGGQHIHAIIVGEGILTDDERGTEIVHDFLINCPNVIS